MLEQLFNLTDRHILVTGGSRGLGLEIAEGFVRSGAKVVVCARSEADLAEAKAHLDPLGHPIVTLTADLAAVGGPADVADRVLAEIGHLDVLVNNAGRGWSEAAEAMKAENIHKLMRLNAEVPFELSAEFARRSMIPRKHGRIINVGSGLGERTRMPMEGREPMAAYASSKAAVHHLTRALAAEWGRYGITVNTIAPGPFPSRMNSTLGDVEASFLGRTPTGRLGQFGDLMGAAIYFASAASAHTTGQTLAIDGGMTLVM